MLSTEKYRGTPEIERLGEEVVQAIRRQDMNLVQSLLIQIIEHLDPDKDKLHKRYLESVSRLILRHGFTSVPQWNDAELEQLIAQGAFIDSQCRLLFIGPAAPRRSGSKRRPELTAIYGHCQEVSVHFEGCRRILLEGLINDEYGKNIAFVPFIPRCTSGLLADSTDEYFIPGDMWHIGSARHLRMPSLLNVEAARLTAEKIGRHLISAIFDSKSSEALNSWLDDPARARRLIALEYLKHEYGHTSSKEIRELIFTGFYTNQKTNRLAAFAHDESRADGTTESNFYQQYISGSDEECDIYAVTMMVRILDLARVARRGKSNEIPQDVDVLTTLKWWEQLTLGGTLYKHRKGRLALAQQFEWTNGAINTDPSRSKVNMAQIIWPMQTWARSVEKDEARCCSAADLEDLVLRNRVGDKMRFSFIRELLEPISTIHMGVKS